MLQTESCVGCGSAKWEVRETWRTYRLATCADCGVTFTLNPDYSRERYVAVYGDGASNLPVPARHEHVYVAPVTRLGLEAIAFKKLIPAPRLAPAERYALTWLKANAPRRSVIIECGCGTGRFLQALQRAGFEVTGTELSQIVVDVLRTRGLRVVLGGLPDFPWNGPAPFAILLFEVLEHLPDPSVVIGRLRGRFPSSCVIVSVPSPRRNALLLHGERSLADYPPNHYVRWTVLGLERVFRNAGYSDVQVILPPPVGHEMLPGLGRVVLRRRNVDSTQGHEGNGRRTTPVEPDRNARVTARLGATLALWILKSYHVAADIIGNPLASQARSKGASAGSLLVIARP